MKYDKKYRGRSIGGSFDSIIIGKELYEQTKSFDEYVFTEIDCEQLSLGKDYQVYSVSAREI